MFGCRVDSEVLGVSDLNLVGEEVRSLVWYDCCFCEVGVCMLIEFGKFIVRCLCKGWGVEG